MEQLDNFPGVTISELGEKVLNPVAVPEFNNSPLLNHARTHLEVIELARNFGQLAMSLEIPTDWRMGLRRGWVVIEKEVDRPQRSEKLVVTKKGLQVGKLITDEIGTYMTSPLRDTLGFYSPDLIRERIEQLTR